MKNYDDMQDIATEHKLGYIDWVEKIALNTGKPMEVGYVYPNGRRELFCKYSPLKGCFYLCNQFRELEK